MNTKPPPQVTVPFTPSRHPLIDRIIREAGKANTAESLRLFELYSAGKESE